MKQSRKTVEWIGVGEEDLSIMAHHVLVDVVRRLVLFTIPKVCCTELIKLMRRMIGAGNWRDLPHYTADRPFLKKLGVKRVEQIVNDPAWTKAILLRDPAERLLSAYLDKYIYTGGYAANVFREGGRYMPFDEFLGYVLDPNRDTRRPTGLHEKADPHWRPQHLVGPVEKFGPAFTHVGDYHDRRTWIRDVLQSVDGWEFFGRDGWGVDERRAIFESNDHPQRTGAGGRMREFYDRETLRAVYQAYAGDIAFARRWRINLVKHADLLA